MPIIIDDNSYISEAEADAYFSDKYGYDKWVLESNKEGALISATQQLDLLCSWYGAKSDPEQLLAFPRTPDADPVPQDIKDAQCEIAYKIVDSGGTTTDGGDPLTELTAGSVTLKFKAGTTGNPLVNDLTGKLLAPYGLCSGTGATKLVPVGRQ